MGPGPWILNLDPGSQMLGPEPAILSFYPFLFLSCSCSASVSFCVRVLAQCQICVFDSCWFEAGCACGVDSSFALLICVNKVRGPHMC